MTRSAPWLAALGAASIALWAALAVVPLLPTNDGPEHVMMGYIESHYDDPGTIYSHYLAPAPQFAGRGFAALFVPLEPLLGWRTAYRVTVYLLLLGWSWGFAALVVALEPRRRWLALLGFATAFQWTVYMGFFAFVAGSAVGLWLLAFAVATRAFSGRRLVVLGLGLLLQGFLHVFSALTTAAVVLALVVARGTPRERLGAAARYALAGLPLLLLFLLTLRHAPTLARMPYAEATWYVPLGDKLGYLHRCFQPGPDWRGLVVLAAAALGVARGALRWRRGDGPAATPALLLVALALLAVAVAAPETLPGWQFFWERFLPLGLLLPLLLLDVERLPRPGALAAAVLVCAYSAASLAAAASMNRKLYERTADVYSGLDQPIARSGLRLPMVRDPWFALPPSRSPVPGMVPMHAVAGLFVAAQGGMIPYMFIDHPAVHEFVGRDEAWEVDFPPRPAPDKLQRVAHLPPGSPERLAALDELALDGTAYEDVILVSAPVDAERFRRRGYVTDYQRGDLYMAHYRGCDVEVELPPVAGLGKLEYGWWPRLDTRRTVELDGAQRIEEGRLRVPLPGAPCGAAWVRLAGGAGPCAGSDEGGRLLVEASPGSRATVRCEPEAPRAPAAPGR